MPLTVDLAVSDAIRTESGESGTSSVDVPDNDAFQLWAESACLGKGDMVVSLQIVSRDEMQELNRNYRGQDKATNVLSFPMQLPDEVSINLLGDLVLCAEVINTEAEEQAKSTDAHWAHMVVHGMLHLQGLDHVNDEDAEKMESAEIKILSKLGFENPYMENNN